MPLTGDVLPPAGSPKVPFDLVPADSVGAIGPEIVVAVCHSGRVTLLEVRQVLSGVHFHPLGILVLVDDVRLEVAKIGYADPLPDVLVGVPLEALREYLRGERVIDPREKTEPQLFLREVETESASEDDLGGPNDEPIDETNASEALWDETEYLLLSLGLETEGHG